MIFTQAILVTIAFTVRYNALYYPIIAAIAFILSRQRWLLKIVGIVLPCTLIGIFIFFTGDRISRVTGKWEFSPFAGWKLATDAIYVYAHIPAERRQIVPKQFTALDNKIKQTFYTIHYAADFLEDDFSYGSFYMFYPESPLILYMDSLYGNDLPFLNTKKWMIVSPLYQRYGIHIMRTYPAYFVKYFFWPNLQRYCIPPLEVFGDETSFHFIPSLKPVAAKWFGIKSASVKKIWVTIYLRLLMPYPILFLLTHSIFAGGFLSFLLLK
jgi:hypothetical protein